MVDFYVPELNMCIEVHGIQHYKKSGFGKDEVDTAIAYTKQLDRDAKLRTICSNKDIPLIEIPYNYSYPEILTALMEAKFAHSGR